MLHLSAIFQFLIKHGDISGFGILIFRFDLKFSEMKYYAWFYPSISLRYCPLIFSSYPPRTNKKALLTTGDFSLFRLPAKPLHLFTESPAASCRTSVHLLLYYIRSYMCSPLSPESSSAPPAPGWFLFPGQGVRPVLRGCRERGDG